MWAGIVKGSLEYLADEISKESTEGVTSFLLAAYSNMGEERNKLLEKLLNKKEIGLDDLGIYQPVQIAKHAKIKRSIDREACSRVKAKVVAIQPFSNIPETSKIQSIQSHKSFSKEIKEDTH